MAKAVTTDAAYRNLWANVFISSGKLPPDKTSDMVVAFQAAFAEMPAREVQVLRYRFGLLDGYEHTIQETALATPNARDPSLFITRERARQIEQRALRRLRHPRRVKFLTGAYQQ